jgi:hypothetical protein
MATAVAEQEATARKAKLTARSIARAVPNIRSDRPAAG